MHVDLLFDHYFNFLSTKTKIYKNEFNLINLDGLEALKIQYLLPDWEYGRIILRFMRFEDHLNCF